MTYLFLIFSLVNAGWTSELWMKVGEVRALPASASAKIRVGARGIVRVIDDDRNVRLIALKSGSTSLVIDQRTYEVRVSLDSQREFVAEMREALADMLGLELSLEGPEPTIRGTLLRFSDWLELSDIARRHQGHWAFRARAARDVADQALGHLRHLAENNSFPILHFRVTPEFIAELPATAQKLKSAVERSLGAFGIRVEMSESDLELAPLVRTQVVLAEVERSFSQTFGVAWPGEYQAQLLPKISGEAQLMGALRALEQNGHAQILASPNLLCRSGGAANFHSGGEFPIRNTGRLASNVVWKQHGVMLNVKPKADYQGAISLAIETEISLLDMAHAIGGVPPLKTNRVSSHFDLPGKRTIALSGLLRAETGQNSEGLPWLGRIPLLSSLFSSKNFQRHRSELIVFVTPEIVSVAEGDTIKMPEGWVSDDL